MKIIERFIENHNKNSNKTLKQQPKGWCKAPPPWGDAEGGALLFSIFVQFFCMIFNDFSMIFMDFPMFSYAK